ncbi:MAG TPA: metallophosphoesterase [Polyangia bacterium]|nr:metallophosphoesterase [Polyangia bacterium]
MKSARAFFSFALALAAAGCSPQHPCATPLTKGPWVERVDDTHATILWESASPGCVEAAFAAESGGKPQVAIGSSTETHVVSSWGINQVKQPDLPGTYYRDEIPLSGLEPSTCYTYRLASSGSMYSGDQNGRFCTARPSGADFTFMGVGDTNPILGHTLPTFKYTLATKPDFIVHLGDMQYYSSAAETWVYWFGAMAPMLRSGALFPTVGNHENENDGTEYDDYYGRLFVPASMDTTTRWYHYETGGVWFFSIDTEEPLDAGSEQTTWLGQALVGAQQQPGFRFSIVYMHRPLYTLGDTSPELTARQVLEPMFMATGVKLVIAGHMHGYERFETPSGITYVTCAGGGGIINDVNANVGNYPNDAPLRVAVSDHYHDCLYAVTAGKISSTVIDELGATIDHFDKAVP